MCCSTDGYVVCEEFEEILRAAWVEEQEIQKQKEKEVCMNVLSSVLAIFCLDLTTSKSRHAYILIIFLQI